MSQSHQKWKDCSVTVMTLALHLHCFLASLSFIHFGVILAWPATAIPAIRWPQPQESCSLELLTNRRWSWSGGAQGESWAPPRPPGLAPSPVWGRCWAPPAPGYSPGPWSGEAPEWHPHDILMTSSRQHHDQVPGVCQERTHTQWRSCSPGLDCHTLRSLGEVKSARKCWNL